MIKNKEKYIKGLSLEELSDLCIKLGYPKYRGNQLFEWMYKHNKLNFSNSSNLPLELIQSLNSNYIISTISIEKKLVSTSQLTQKFLFKTSDSMYIESVSMIEGKRHTICISSQIGCNVGCKFCATGKMGLRRNLHTGEILDQIIYIKEHISQPITNIVYMGMGEPFLNYTNVIKSADILNHPKGFNFGAKRITISTVGIVPKIKKFIDEKRKYQLAISLNASNNKTRNSIIPINKKWPIEDIINVSYKYVKTYKDKLTFEYVLLKNVNDSIVDAFKLWEKLRGIPSKLNIIPYNDIGSEFERSTTETINSFIKELTNRPSEYQVLVRWSKGQGIEAGCGQLATVEP